jgi:hypothetical protein
MPIIPPQELGFLGSLTACMPSSSLNFMPAYVSCCMIPTKRFIHNYLTPATLPDIFRWLWFLRTYKVGKDVWSHLLEFLHALRNEFLKIGTVPSDFHIHKLCIKYSVNLMLQVNPDVNHFQKFSFKGNYIEYIIRTNCNLFNNLLYFVSFPICKMIPPPPQVDDFLWQTCTILIQQITVF